MGHHTNPRIPLQKAAVATWEVVPCHRPTGGFTFLQLLVHDIFRLDWISVHLVDVEEQVCGYGERKVCNILPFIIGSCNFVSPAACCPCFCLPLDLSFSLLVLTYLCNNAVCCQQGLPPPLPPTRGAKTPGSSLPGCRTLAYIIIHI